MTEHDIPTVDEGSQHDKEPWTPPVVRETIPARKTAGGGGALRDQDDVFYTS